MSLRNRGSSGEWFLPGHYPQTLLRFSYVYSALKKTPLSSGDWQTVFFSGYEPHPSLLLTSLNFQHSND
uniref:Uncharacterized protein n=1 Tax=Anguilla anguilla TaxID=7936 RepID=A0A0E9QY98_ANGAN